MNESQPEQDTAALLAEILRRLPERNGTTAYISFGEGDSDEMPVKWAEQILTLLYADPVTRPIFAELMLKRIGIDKADLPRRRANA